MSFLAEDGTGLAGANSYLSEAEALAYATDRQNTAWAALSSATQQNYLMQASLYADGRFQWRGIQKTEAQGLAWPRDFAYNDAGYSLLLVPERLKRAVFLYASRISAATPLLPDPVYDETNAPLKEVTEVVGPITETRKFEAGSSPVTFRAYPEADMLLKELIEPYQTLQRGG